MCTVCGCDGDGNAIEGRAKTLRHAYGDGHSGHHPHHHGHDHDHPHHHAHGAEDGVEGQMEGFAGRGEAAADGAPFASKGGNLHFGKGIAGVSAPGQSQTRLIAIERDVLAKNDEIAAQNRVRLAASEVTAINLMSSPGSGKTTLLVETLKALGGRRRVAVIEGDQQTSNDAERIRSTGAPAIQVNTGKGCHLDAEMVSEAISRLEPAFGSILFIENVGNLVCPASFDLGEAYKVVLASTTEGEDKPLKYPDMFAAADLVVVTKMDLTPHLDFDLGLLIENARRVNPGVDVVTASAKAPHGLGYWLAWLDGHSQPAVAAAE